MLIYVKLVLTALFWGGTFIAGRILAAGVAPFPAAFLRFCFALVLLVPALLLVRQDWPRRPSALVFALVLGATGVFGYNAFFFLGLKLVDAGRASLIIACQPVSLAVFSALIFREPLPARGVFGVAVCLLGAAVVISRGEPAALLRSGLGLGETYILCCVACWTAFTLVGKRAMRHLSPMAATTLSCACGTALLFPFAMAQDLGAILPAVSAGQWLALAYLGVCGTALGFTWYYQGVRALGPSRAGVFINLVPVSAVAMGGLFLGERVDASLVTGAALVLFGVYQTNRARA